MSRHDDWQKRFWDGITAAKSKPFVWGDHDCVMFATSMIDAVIDTDYFAQAKVRYPYTTMEEAVALMDAHGGITGLVESFLAPHVNWGRLTAGDVVLVSKIPLRTDMETLCVHDGTQLVGPAPGGGLTAMPFRYAQYGWLIR